MNGGAASPSDGMHALIAPSHPFVWEWPSHMATYPAVETIRHPQIMAVQHRMAEAEDSLDSGGRCTFLNNSASTSLAVLVSRGAVSLPLLPSLATRGLVMGLLATALMKRGAERRELKLV